MIYKSFLVGCAVVAPARCYRSALPNPIECYRFFLVLELRYLGFDQFLCLLRVLLMLFLNFELI